MSGYIDDAGDMDYMDYMDDIEKLMEKEAFETDDALFERAMLECFRYHYNNCHQYQLLCHTAIPYILVHALKYYELLSVPMDEVVLTLSSSGTSGQKTRLFLNDVSLVNLKRIAEKVYSGVGLVDKEQIVNYLCFSYDPKYAKDVGTAWSDENNTSFTKVNDIFYTLRWNGKDFFFDMEGTIERLKAYEKSGLPVRVLGFPAYIYAVLKTYKKRYGRLNLGDESYALIGGGWKGKKELDKEKFRIEISEVLGIPEQNIRDCYGLAEHGVPYVECEYGKMHIPIYSKVLVRDPITLEQCKAGEVGLLHLMTPYNLTTPYLSILTTDYGLVKNDCDCGIDRPYIEIKSRAGLKRHRGCAISASDYLK